MVVKKKLVLKKKAKLFLSLVFILIVVLISLGVFVSSKKLVFDYDKKIRVNVFDEVNILDSVNKIKNGKIITKDKLLDTSKVGKVKVVIKVKNYFGFKKKFKYELIVVDKEAPEIDFKKELETDEGEEIDLLKDVKVSDNSKEKIIPKVEGNYDFKKSGEYKLYYVATDSSGNEKKEEFTLKVKEKENKKRVNSKVKKTSKGFEITEKDGVTYIDGYLVVNKTYSLPEEYGDGLRSETTKNFNSMKDAAKKDGLDIYISSGYRSFNKQNTIYNNYVKKDGKEEADTYSARAGHSEHQSGYAVDVNIIDDSFADTKEAKWLAKNCYKYGFILRYPKGKSDETGYKYESWHFRYVGEELARKLYNDGDWITMESYFGITSKYN